MCDRGDIFPIPGNTEKILDQVTEAISHSYASGPLPIFWVGGAKHGRPLLIAGDTGGTIWRIAHCDPRTDAPTQPEPDAAQQPSRREQQEQGRERQN